MIGFPNPESEKEFNNYLTEIKDPFQKDCIDTVFFHISRNIFTKEPEFCSTVKFQNGNTYGEQKFKEESFEVLLKKTITFINSL